MGLLFGEWKHSFTWKWQVGNRVCVRVNNKLFSGKVLNRKRTLLRGDKYYLIEINKVGSVWVYERQIS